MLDVSHNRIEDPEVLEVFASMENLVRFFSFPIDVMQGGLGTCS